jgi:hypothetical protein
MHVLRITVSAAIAAVLVTAGCRTVGTSSTTGDAGPVAQTAPPTQRAPIAQPSTSTSTRPASSAARVGPDSTRPRRRPDPRQQEASRQNVISQIMKEIAGRENEPAGRVFKNVKLLKDMPAAELLRTMNEQYGRGLGWMCGSCHVPGEWDSDQKENKVIARQMQQLVTRINTRDLPAIPQLEREFDQVNCVTCHRGSNHPANTMDVPAAPATTPPSR